MMWRSQIYYYWAGVHRYFGMVNGVMREFRRAVHYYTKAYETDPTFRRARLNRAILLGRELGELDAALADFDALLAQDPKYGEALFNRAMVYQEQGKFAAALEDLQTYLSHAEDQHYAAEAKRAVVLLKEIADDV